MESLLKNGHNSIIELLIKNEANIESIPIDIEFEDIVEGLIEEEDDEILEDFLEHGDEQEILQATPLYMAIENNHTETCKLLVDHGADFNFRYHGFSILHISVINGNLELVKFFIEKGINVNTEDDNEGYTPLYSAAYEGHLDIVNILIENGAYINTFKLGDEKKSSKLSRWPVFGAIEQNNLKIAQILIDHGAIIENIETRESILIYLCDLIDSDFIEMNMEIVEFLVNNGADINFNNGNDTPLSVAIMRDWEELEEYLMKKEPVLILSIIMDYITSMIYLKKNQKK